MRIRCSQAFRLLSVRKKPRNRKRSARAAFLYMSRLASRSQLQTRPHISMVILESVWFDVTGSCNVISPDHFVRGFYYSSFRRCGLNFLVLQKDNKILVHNLSIHEKLEQSTHWNILKVGKDFTFGSGCTVLERSKEDSSWPRKPLRTWLEFQWTRWATDQEQRTINNGIPEKGIPNILNSTLNPSAPPFKPQNRPPSPPPRISKPRCRQTNSSISNKSLMVGHININRLRHKTHHVQDSSINTSWQFFAYGKRLTWLDCNIADCEVSIPDFRLFHNDRKNKKGGVYVYSFIPFSLQTNYPWNTQKSTLSNRNQRQFYWIDTA